MSSPPAIRVAMVNHAAVDIAKSPDVVWKEILHSYLAGEKFSAQGHKVTPLADELSAPLGGYRIVLHDPAGAVIDDRICRITENDPVNRRLSLFADYVLPVFNGMIVNASYQAAATNTGARYLLDSYSLLNLHLEPGDTQKSVAEKVAMMQSQAGGYLDSYLRGVKAHLEALP